MTEQKIYLTHSAKGQTWGKHKYIAIKNGRYIYPEDVAGEGSARQLRREATEQLRKDVSGHKADKEKIHRDVDHKFAMDDALERALSENYLEKKKREFIAKKAEQIKNKKQSETTKRQSEANIYPEDATSYYGKRSQDLSNSRRNFAELYKNAHRTRQGNEQILKRAEAGLAKKLNPYDKNQADYSKKRIERAKNVENFYAKKSSEAAKRQSEANIENSRGKFKEVDETNIIDYAIKNGLKATVKKFGQKGKAFLLSLFGKK